MELPHLGYRPSTCCHCSECRCRGVELCLHLLVHKSFFIDNNCSPCFILQLGCTPGFSSSHTSLGGLCRCRYPYSSRKLERTQVMLFNVIGGADRIYARLASICAASRTEKPSIQ